MPRIHSTAMDISLTFADFCIPIVQLVTGHWPLVTYTVKTLMHNLQLFNYKHRYQYLNNKYRRDAEPEIPFLCLMMKIIHAYKRPA